VLKQRKIMCNWMESNRKRRENLIRKAAGKYRKLSRRVLLYMFFPLSKSSSINLGHAKPTGKRNRSNCSSRRQANRNGSVFPCWQQQEHQAPTHTANALLISCSHTKHGHGSSWHITPPNHPCTNLINRTPGTRQASMPSSTSRGQKHGAGE
jgi:hypothetical protein